MIHIYCLFKSGIVLQIQVSIFYIFGKIFNPEKLRILNGLYFHLMVGIFNQQTAPRCEESSFLPFCSLHVYSYMYVYIYINAYTQTRACMLSRLCVLNHFSHVWLFVTLRTVARQAPMSMEFSRQEHWSGLLCPPGDLPDLLFDPNRDWTFISCISCIGRRILYHWATWEAHTHTHTHTHIYMYIHMHTYTHTHAYNV